MFASIIIPFSVNTDDAWDETVWYQVIDIGE